MRKHFQTRANRAHARGSGHGYTAARRQDGDGGWGWMMARGRGGGYYNNIGTCVCGGGGDCGSGGDLVVVTKSGGSGGGGTWECGNGDSSGWTPFSPSMSSHSSWEFSPLFSQMIAWICGGVPSPLIEPKMVREGERAHLRPTNLEALI